jgi:hypothetical protein
VPADAGLDLVVVGDRLDDNLDIECPLAPQAPLVPHQTVFGAGAAGGWTSGLHVVDPALRWVAKRVSFGSTSKAFGPKRYVAPGDGPRRTGFALPTVVVGRRA